jgi:hypothetical protein
LHTVAPQHVPFPGFPAAFHADWNVEPAHVIEDIDPAQLDRVLRLENRHEAVRSAVDLYVNRLVEAHNRLERTPDFWFVVIPEIVFQLGRPKTFVPKTLRVKGSVSISARRARELQSEPTMFGLEELEAQVYRFASDFRRQLKARLLDHRIVTQIVRETTLTPDEFRNIRSVEDEATIAWKLCTAAFYKSGGRPWQLANIRDGVCYVGLVYKKAELSGDSRHACCAAQMFLANGDGIVFRGALGPWFREDSRQFHLDRPASRELLKTVLEEYYRLHKRNPAELFIHAQSAFTSEEWDGFVDVCPKDTCLVGVQIADGREDLKLFRPGNYPVVRGTALKLSDRRAFLWTSGYVERLDTYMGPETPNPLLVRILRGNVAMSTVLKDILALTKINFNSCLHNDRLPITIRFANAVGDVLVSAPISGEPKLPFKYYI